jgi:hypothetical protein
MLHEIVKTSLDDRWLAFAKALTLDVVNIQADDRMANAGKTCGRYRTDITETENADPARRGVARDDRSNSRRAASSRLRATGSEFDKIGTVKP